MTNSKKNIILILKKYSKRDYSKGGLKMKEILVCEKELKELIGEDKKTWTRFYVLMKKIEEEELYKELGLKSFTAWVKDFSMKNKIHESVLWNRKKAGRVYENYQRVKEEQGVNIVPIEQAEIGVDSLVLLDKITSKNKELGAELADKAINKEITREDLRTAYKVIRGDISSSKQKKHDNSKETNQIDKDTLENLENNNSDNDDIDIEEEIKENVTATKIVNAMSEPSWLGVAKEKKYFAGAYERDKYKALTEFPVYTGTTKHSRRIDVLIAENLRVENHYSLNLHGIEIKVSKSDFEKDKKYTEYADYVNFLWIAIPKNLIECVENNTPADVGIVYFEKDKMHIYREAKRLNPVLIKDSLTTLSLRLI